MVTTPDKKKDQPVSSVATHSSSTSSSLNLYTIEDFSQFLIDRWQLFTALVVLILMVVIGQGIYKSMAEKKLDKLSGQDFTFHQQSLVPFKEGKLDSKSFLDRWKGLDAELKTHSIFFTTLLETSSALSAKKMWTEAIDFLETAKSKMDLSTHQKFFLDYHLAVLYEENQQKEKAVQLYEQIVQGKTQFMAGKLYMDIGRLYRDLGNNEKAKNNFQYVLNSYPNQREWVQMAKYYLGQMEK